VILQREHMTQEHQKQWWNPSNVKVTFRKNKCFWRLMWIWVFCLEIVYFFTVFKLLYILNNKYICKEREISFHLEKKTILFKYEVQHTIVYAPNFVITYSHNVTEPNLLICPEQWYRWISSGAEIFM
jgi:hypothetical protein